VKKIIPSEVAELSRKILEQHGDFLYHLAEKTADPGLKRKRFAEAGEYFDAAAFFGVVEGETYRRKHILDSGQRKPRQRRKSDLNPATDSTSKTKNSPTG